MRTRYVVKWTDVGQGYHFPCEKRGLTKARAQQKVAELERRVSRNGAALINIRMAVDV